MTTFASLKDQVESLYVGYFGRTDDGAGTSYWVSQIESGAMTLAKVAESFAVQPEALAKYSYLSAPSTSSPTDFINQVYQQLFNHAADAAGLAYWTAQLAAAQGSPQAIGQFIGNVISGATGADDATVKSKLDAAPAATPKVPDIGTTSTAPVTLQAPTEIVRTNDAAPPVTGGTTSATGDLAATAGNMVFPASAWTLGSVDQFLIENGMDVTGSSGVYSVTAFDNGSVTTISIPVVYADIRIIQADGIRIVFLDGIGFNDFTIVAG